MIITVYNSLKRYKNTYLRIAKEVLRGVEIVMNTRYLMLLLVVAVVSGYAHQPRIVMGLNLTLEEPYEIVQPEISRAYYGELTGSPQYYIIEARDPFELYVQVNSPLAPKEARRFSLQILNSSKEPIVDIYENESDWHQWFEPYGGDWYLMGPEYKKTLPAGIYYIKVYNKGDTGKYALAVGEKEDFTFGEMINALILVPTLKQAFFGKDVLMNFMHLAGIMLGLGAISIIALSGSIFIKHRRMGPKEVNVYYATKYIVIVGALITALTWIMMYAQNPESIMGMVKSVLIGITVLLAIALALFINPKPDTKTERSNVKYHAHIIILSLIAWWAILLLTVAMI